MRAFEQLIEEGEGVNICISGQFMDSGMSIEEALAYFRAEGVSYRKIEEFFYKDRDWDHYRLQKGPVSFYLMERVDRLDQAKKIGIEGLKTHIEIIPGDIVNLRLEKDSIIQAKREFLGLLRYHVENKIPGTSYYPYRKVFQAVNKPI